MISFLIISAFFFVFKNNKRQIVSLKQGNELDSTLKNAAFGSEEFWTFCRTMNDPKNQNIVLNKILSIDRDEKVEWWNSRDYTSVSGDGCTVLHYAAMSGAIDVVKCCLEHGANPNSITITYESTPLKYAVIKGHLEIVKLFVEYCKLDVWDRRDYFGYNTIQYACLNGFSEAASILSDLPSDFKNDLGEASESSSLSPMHDDLLFQYILRLLSYFPSENNDNDDVNSVDPATGFTPLHIACSIGNIDIVNSLLGLGAYCDVPNHEGRTPLFFAVTCGHDHIVQLLIEEWKADINAFTNVLTSDLMRSAPTIDNINFSTPGWTLLHEACEKNRLSCVELLLRKGDSVININKCNVGKETPLMIAVHNNNTKVAKLLLQNGADPRIGDDWNSTPLHLACKREYSEELVSMLIDNGALINARNNHDETPLHHACWFGHIDIADYLVNIWIENNKECDITDLLEMRNKNQQTPLDYARQRGHTKLITKVRRWLTKMA